MTDKKIKDFTKGIEEIAKLHPADRKKVFQMVADRNGAAAAGYVEKKVNDYETARNMLKKSLNNGRNEHEKSIYTRRGIFRKINKN